MNSTISQSQIIYDTNLCFQGYAHEMYFLLCKIKNSDYFSRYQTYAVNKNNIP